MWRMFEFLGLKIEAKIFDNPSRFGLDGGRISHMRVWNGDNEVMLYDRHWVFNDLSDTMTHLIIKFVELWS